jgi:hypothetical protein
MKFLTTLLFHLSMSQLGVISVGTLLDRRRWRPEVFTFYNIFIFWRRLTIRFCVRRRRARKHPLTVVVPPIFIFRCERRIYVDFCEGELLRRNTGDPFCTKWRLFVIGRDCHICNSPVSSLSFSYVFRIFCNSAQKEMTNITINAARSTNSTSMLGVLIGFFVFVEIIVWKYVPHCVLSFSKCYQNNHWFIFQFNRLDKRSL